MFALLCTTLGSVFAWLFPVECLLVEWDGEEGHSVIGGKNAELTSGSEIFCKGAKVVCHLTEGDYTATVVYAGVMNNTCMLSMYGLVKQYIYMWVCPCNTGPYHSFLHVHVLSCLSGFVVCIQPSHCTIYLLTVQDAEQNAIKSSLF